MKKIKEPIRRGLIEEFPLSLLPFREGEGEGEGEGD